MAASLGRWRRRTCAPHSGGAGYESRPGEPRPRRDVRLEEEGRRKERPRSTSGKLTELQKPFWAGRRHGLLVVLQGIDASGKDSTINKVMSAFDPQGCFVAGFREPTGEELAHDFLWRVHRHVPGKGEIAIFNRSHYEQVLIVRVHGLEPRRVWSHHYRQIRDFEQLLVETGTASPSSSCTSRATSSANASRIASTTRPSAGSSRRATSPNAPVGRLHRGVRRRPVTHFDGNAPWYVVPANRLWFRDLAIATHPRRHAGRPAAPSFHPNPTCRAIWPSPRLPA